MTDRVATAAAIKTAIDRSISHDEIVSVILDGDSGDALVAIGNEWDGEFDYDYEGEDVMDVWGYHTDETHEHEWRSPNEHEYEWRLSIKFNETSGD